MVSPEPNHGIAENRAYIDYMPADEDRKRRQSIAYIMRRRKRGRKTGANSGAPVNSVQRKIRGHVTFTPSGGASGWWRGGYIVVGLLLSVFPIFVFALASSPRLNLVAANSPWAWVFIVSVACLLVPIIAFALAYTGLASWRVARALWPYKNE